MRKRQVRSNKINPQLPSEHSPSEILAHEALAHEDKDPVYPFDPIQGGKSKDTKSQKQDSRNFGHKRNKRKRG